MWTPTRASLSSAPKWYRDGRSHDGASWDGPIGGSLLKCPQAVNSLAALGSCHRPCHLLVLLITSGCIEVTIPADDAGSSRQPPTGEPRVTPGTPTTSMDDVSAFPGPGLELLDSRGSSDSGTPVVACVTHCDCAGGQDCINGRCVSGELSIYCCGSVDCPAGSDCWSADGDPGLCGSPGAP